MVKSLANSKDYTEGGSEGARKLTERVRRVRPKLGDCAGAERGALLKLHDRLYYLDGKEVVRPSCRVEGNEGPTDTGAEGEGTSGLLPHGSEVRAISPGRARRMRMDRFLVDHMARSGYHESAAAIANVSKVSNLVDSSTFRDAQRIIDDLRKRKTASALEWCNRNRARLKKIGSRLEFCLRCQDLVEMAREASELQKFDAKDMGLGGPGAESSGGLSSATAAAARGASNAKKIEAVEYARRYLSPFAQCEGQRLQETMATLVFGPDTSIQKYRRLYSSTQWTDLQTQMVTDLCRINGLPTTSYMNIYLQAGLSSLKTPCTSRSSGSSPSPSRSRNITTASSSASSRKLASTRTTRRWCCRTDTSIQSGAWRSWSRGATRANFFAPGRVTGRTTRRRTSSRLSFCRIVVRSHTCV